MTVKCLHQLLNASLIFVCITWSFPFLHFTKKAMRFLGKRKGIALKKFSNILRIIADNLFTGLCHVQLHQRCSNNNDDDDVGDESNESDVKTITFL